MVRTMHRLQETKPTQARRDDDGDGENETT